MLSNPFNEFRQRIDGDQNHLPLVTSHVFIVSYSIYVAGMFYMTLTRPDQFPVLRAMGAANKSGFESAGIISISLFLVSLVWGYMLRKDLLHIFSLGLPGVRPRSLLLPFLYIVASFVGIFSEGGLTLMILSKSAIISHNDILVYMIAQAMLIGLVHEISAHPLSPDAKISKLEYQKRRENWWRLAQTLFTGVAVIVALMALSENGLSITDHWGFFLPLFGIVWILLYILWKQTLGLTVEIVEEHRRH